MDGHRALRSRQRRWQRRCRGRRANWLRGRDGRCGSASLAPYAADPWITGGVLEGSGAAGGCAVLTRGEGIGEASAGKVPPRSEEPHLEGQVHAGKGGEADHVGEACGGRWEGCKVRGQRRMCRRSRQSSASTRMKGRPLWGNRAGLGAPASLVSYASVPGIMEG